MRTVAWVAGGLFGWMMSLLMFGAYLTILVVCGLLAVGLAIHYLKERREDGER